MAEIKTKIPAEMEPAAVGGMVADAKYIIDRVKNKTQVEINADTEERVSTLEESVGTGGSVDERIAVEKNRAEQAEGVLDGKVATEKQRAEGVEGGLNTRLQTVEQLASISVGGGDIGIGTAADFESDDPSDLAKVPTVGAMLGGANDGVYDISARHSGTKYADLAAALGTNGANVPVGVRKGGMSVKFVQSSDNKYVQYRLMAQNFTTDVIQWQGVDDEPTSGSKNLVESGGVEKYTGTFEEIQYNGIGFIDTTRQESQALYYENGIVGFLVDTTIINPDNAWKYVIVECNEGDVFTITGKTLGWVRLYTWLDKYNRILSCADSIIEVKNKLIVAPKNAKYLVSNNLDLENGSLYYGTSVKNIGSYINTEREIALKYYDMNLDYIIGGMDNGIGNVDTKAIHSAQFLKIINDHVCFYNKSYGLVLQLFNNNKEYIDLLLFYGQGFKHFNISERVQGCEFVKICLFSNREQEVSPTNPKVDNSKESIENLHLYFSGLAKEECDTIDYPILTKAFKASSVNDGTILFERTGEGVIDQIQLIGAFDTTRTPKYEVWPNYYQTILQVTVDGDISLRGSIYDLCGLSSQIISNEEYGNGIFENAVFQTPLFSKTGLYSGITFNFKIPYYRSIKVELLGTSGLMWGMVKSLTNVDFEIGGVKIPYGAKFHGITVSQSCEKGDQIVLMNTTKSGMLLGVNVAGTSNMFDWVEGCIRAFKYGLTTQDKCTMLSSGLEDYLGGAFGFNIGEKQFENWGCTLNKMTQADNYRLCGYRNHINDKVTFDCGGFKITARWGDQNAASWNLSTTDNFAGQTGNPGVGNFYATAFYYDWE